MNKVIKRFVKELTKAENNEKFVKDVCILLLKTKLITYEEENNIKIEYYDNKLKKI